jgi:hypothetical protein
MFEKGVPMLHVRIRVGSLLALFALATVACIGQENVSEGERCNPFASSNTCASGLVCTGQGSSPTIPFCPENYCCAVNAAGEIDSTNPNCQPGCNGGAASICNADKDPGACAFADGGSLQASEALDSDGGGAAPTPVPDAGSPEGSAEGGD